MYKKLFIILTAFLISFASYAQDNYLNSEAPDNEKIYNGGEEYKVKMFKQNFKTNRPKNVVLLIGDGMGTAHIFAGLTANRGNLFLENCKYTGFSKTSSHDNYITDSAAAGTALATGTRTYNGAISVDPEKNPLTTILEEAENNGLATGLVATSSITHATPASFIAHEPERNLYENIAADFLDTDIDVFIGGGLKHFTEREDGRNLLNELKNKGYTVLTDLNEIKKVKKGKLAGMTADIHNGRLEERGNMLPVSVSTAINILDNNKKGFFLMVEGSQIDWGGHANSTVYIVEEFLDFDRSLGEVLKFAARDGETLVVVTSDHETGGMAVLNGDFSTGMVQGEFTTGSHTALMVPVFAYGPGAEEFIGIMNNTDVHDKIKKLLLSKQ
jgi:alkaline phosphatase